MPTGCMLGGTATNVIITGASTAANWTSENISGEPLTGHHLGIYGQAFTYDFETGHKGYIGGKPGGTL